MAREREQLDAFDTGVKMQDEAVAEQKQELVLCHDGPPLNLICISMESVFWSNMDRTQFYYSHFFVCGCTGFASATPRISDPRG